MHVFWGWGGGGGGGGVFLLVKLPSSPRQARREAVQLSLRYPPGYFKKDAQMFETAAVRASHLRPS